MVDGNSGLLGTMKVLSAVLFLVALQCSWALSPTNCDASEPVAEKAVDLINRGRRNGYLFQLLRVADAHLDRVGPATVYYLVLDVKESDCWVLSTKPPDDCLPAGSRRPSDIVIGQCKVIATRHSNESQDLRVNDYNCTTSSVSSALRNTKDSPVLLDFFPDTENYRKQADKALDKYKRENGDFAAFRVDQVERVIRGRGGERTNYYVDFSVRNCSTHHLHRYPTIFGFCRANFYYSIEASDLETPEDIVINCEVFNFEEHRNISGVKPHRDHLHHFGRHECSGGKHSCKSNGSRDHHHHPHKTHKLGCPPPPEGKDYSERPLPQGGAPPPLPPHHPAAFGADGTHGHPHSRNTEDKHPPHGHHPHGHHPHGHHPHGHHPHGHHPRGHHPHGHHPHDHDFLDYGPCDPPSNSQELKGHHHDGHGAPHDHSGERGPGKGHVRFQWRGHGAKHGHSGERGPGKEHFPFHQQQVGYVHRLPPLRVGEVLPLPEASFPSFSLPNCKDPLRPEIQPFPNSASESCPGKFKSEIPQIFKFFAYASPK